MPLIGDAALVYSGSSGSATVNLGAPLLIEESARLKRRYTHRPLTGGSPDRVVIGSGVKEVTVRISFNEDPLGLVDALHAAAGQGVTLTYYPSLADTGTSYAFTLVGMTKPEIVRDRQFPDNFFQMWEATVRLRTTADISALVTP